MKQRFLSASLIALAAAAPISLSAQQLSTKIADLIRFGNCGQPLCIATGAGEHQTHYLGSATTASTELTEFLNNAITASVGRLPVSATSSGTSFSFVNGAPVQSNTSSGPIFAERAATLGAKKFLFGANVSQISFSKLRGESLSDLNLNLSHQDVGNAGLGDSPFESDIVGIDLNMKLNLTLASFFATYGISDRVDVSVAVPFGHASLTGNATGRIYSATGTVSGAHTFGTAANPSLTAASTASGSSTGIGDITARMKVNLKNSTTSGVALLGLVHIPTGDEMNFLGSGAVSGSAMLVASSTYGKFSPHANVGFAIRTGSSENNAVLGTFGFDQLVNKNVTIAVDVLSEFQAGGDAGDLPKDINLNLLATPQVIKGTNIPSTKDNPIGLSAGGRFSFGAATLIANGVIPVKSGGMQANFIGTLGFEYGFR